MLHLGAAERTDWVATAVMVKVGKVGIKATTGRQPVTLARMPNRFGQLICSGGRQSRLLDRGQLTAPTDGVNSKDHIVSYNIKHFSEPLSLNNR